MIFHRCLLLVLLFTSCRALADDTLRGSNNAFRKDWDVLHYNLDLDLNLKTRVLSGKNTIRFRTLSAVKIEMQIDLQEPLNATSFALRALTDTAALAVTQVRRQGNHYLLHLPATLAAGRVYELVCTYEGTPREARNAPWDGGFVWRKSASGAPWVAIACQGDGASLWFPCKDLQSDEPDSGATIRIRNSENLPVISNGLLVSGTPSKDGVWQVKSSINPYNITFYTGDYMGWTDVYKGVSGKLPLSFYVLRENESKARKQFAVVPKMLGCFEENVGPYPFYNDGYKLVEAPYLGMEHQSAVAYGNHYNMGYLGEDRSRTGVGKSFDYIIIHESGHEWFGNSITAQDVADNWIHEGFTTYLESLFVECILGKETALKYLHGERDNIVNDVPVIGAYGVFDEGSGDKYDKGAAIIGMLRAMHSSDEIFWQNFRNFYAHFAHSTVTSAQVEAWWSEALGRDLKPFFDQYLRTTDIPKLQLRKMAGGQEARFANVANGFSLPLFWDASGKPIRVGETWTAIGKKRASRPEFLVRE